jgi:hypothetical protein
MKIPVRTALAALTVTFAVTAIGQDLPRSGVITVHSGYMVKGEPITVGDQHVQGHGTNRGVSYNDQGAGPLHRGPTDCFHTFDLVNDKLRVSGFCTFGDADGDRFFTEFTGATMADGWVGGSHNILSGTGKYSGITGTVAWKCKYVGKNDELDCNQRVDYRLP